MFYDPLSPFGQSQQQQYDNQYRMKPQVGAHTHNSQGQVMMGPLGVQQPPPSFTGGQQPSPFTPTNPFSSFPKDLSYQPKESIAQTPPINTTPPSTGGKG